MPGSDDQSGGVELCLYAGIQRRTSVLPNARASKTSSSATDSIFCDAVFLAGARVRMRIPVRARMVSIFLLTAFLSSGSVHAADHIFLDGFEIPTFRGTNLAGMEMAYFNYDPNEGPIADHDYPVYNTRVIDYYASKRINALRFLFSWEAMQSTLGGTIPAATSGNYKIYFDNYKRIVDYATDVKGMRVIIEPWQADSFGNAGGPRWRGGLVGSVAVPTAAFADFWGKMAANFNNNALVSYGLVNEPNNMSTLSWFASAQAA